VPAVAPPPPAEPSAIRRFNKKLALKITGGVGTMWCAYAFAMFAMTGFPGLLPVSLSKYALWGSTVFSQLVLLSVILVGQNSQAATGEKRAQATYLGLPRLWLTVVVL
jgi:bacteriorhodopsin